MRTPPAIERLETRDSGGRATLGGEAPIRRVLSERGEDVHERASILGTGADRTDGTGREVEEGGGRVRWESSEGQVDARGRAPGRARAVLTGNTNAGPRWPSRPVWQCAQTRG